MACSARHDMAQHRTARHGTARHGTNGVVNYLRNVILLNVITHILLYHPSRKFINLSIALRQVTII